jgi:hypothetical protein
VTAACAETRTELSCSDAYAVIEPYFLAMQEVFLESPALRKAKVTRLYVAPWVHDAPRHYAACRDDGKAIVVAPELAELDERMVLAILAHELGHACDFLYAGEFVLGKERSAQRRSREDFTEKQWAKWMRAWSERDDDTVEFTADAVAQLATGMVIGYTGPCQLQSFERGQARPQGLR